MQFPDFGNFPKYDDIWSLPGVKAAIDIGTNTVLLLVADVENGRVKPLLEMQRLPRLGKGVDDKRVLSIDRMEAVIMVLHEYRTIIQEKFGEIPVIVTATSAVRDAQNKMEFIWMTEEATGYRVRLLSGSEEAKCSFSGAASQINNRPDEIICFDIGGGSTEISYQLDGQVGGVSFDIGSVRLSEKIKSDSEFESLSAVRSYINSVLVGNPVDSEQLNWRHSATGRTLIGVAGTATTIAALAANQGEYSSNEINGSFVSAEFVQELVNKFWGLDPQEILKVNENLLKGREDLILSGCLIVAEILNLTGVDGFTTSTGGIRHGALLNQLYR